MSDLNSEVCNSCLLTFILGLRAWYYIQLWKSLLHVRWAITGGRNTRNIQEKCAKSNCSSRSVTRGMKIYTWVMHFMTCINRNLALLSIMSREKFWTIYQMIDQVQFVSFAKSNNNGEFLFQEETPQGFFEDAGLG